MVKVIIDLSEGEQRLVNLIRFTQNIKSKAEAIKIIIALQKEHINELMKKYFEETKDITPKTEN